MSEAHANAFVFFGATGDLDYHDAATFDGLRSSLGGATRPAHYLAIPSALFGTSFNSWRRPVWRRAGG